MTFLYLTTTAFEGYLETMALFISIRTLIMQHKNYMFYLIVKPLFEPSKSKKKTFDKGV